MSDDRFLKTLADSLNQNASVKSVFGEPIRAGDKVIIPVAQVILGLGSGYGQVTRQDKKVLPPDPDPSQPELSAKSGNPAEGGGGGGGMYVNAKGVYEITPTGSRFIPAYGLREVLFYLAAGFLLGRLSAPKPAKNKK